MKTTHYHIDAPFDLTAVLLADFHSCVKKTQSRKAYIGRILEAVKNANPDLILSTGDVFNNTDSASVNDCFNENGLRLLSGACKIAPLYYSIGNHEHGLSENNRKAVESVGVTVLDNESTLFRDIRIGGLTTGYLKDKNCYTEPPVPDLGFLRRFSEQDGYKILLCHHPEYWKKYIVNSGINLTVSGHAHGGQWGFFGQRGVFAPGQGLFAKYVRGLYRGEDGSVLAVSRGMTNTVPVPRFFNPCEIVVLHFSPNGAR